MKLEVVLREQRERRIVIEVDVGYPAVHDLVRDFKKLDAASFEAEDLAGVVNRGDWNATQKLIRDVFIIPE